MTSATAIEQREYLPRNSFNLESIDRFFSSERLADESLNNLGDDTVALGPRSGDTCSAWFIHEVRGPIGVGVFDGAVRRPVPVTDVQVRRTPSSTGKLVEWEGVVESVEADKFNCRLRVVKGSSVDFDEFTSILLDEVDPGDLALVRPGALFRLVLGLQATGGTRQHFFNIIFRRLPAWNKRSMERAYSQFEELIKNINWSDESST